MFSISKIFIQQTNFTLLSCVVFVMPCVYYFVVVFFAQAHLHRLHSYTCMVEHQVVALTGQNVSIYKIPVKSCRTPQFFLLFIAIVVVQVQ